MTDTGRTRVFSASVRDGTADVIGALASEAGLEKEKVRLVFVFGSPSHPMADAGKRGVLAFPSAVVLSATTAGEFTERGETRGGASALAVSGDFKVFGGFAKGLKADPEGAVRAALAGLPSEVSGYPHLTAFLHVDALAGTGEEATLVAADLLGPSAQIAGAAAGDDLAMKSTSVGLGGEISSDAVSVALVFSKTPLAIGVAHAHAPISPPLHVTAAEGNVVREIDGRPAWEVWKENTRAAAAQRGIDPDALAPSDVIGYLLRYEAGLATGDAYKIRAPLSVQEDGSIAFACGIPKGTVIRITESNPEGQRAAARLAAERARERLDGRPVAGAVVFDCICRRLILDAEFERAVVAIGTALGGVPIGGIETYGEIAMTEGDLSGFHNTTSVVVAFPVS